MAAVSAPHVREVQIVPVQPEAAERRTLDFRRRQDAVELEDMVFLVKIYLEQPLKPTGAGYALYLGDDRVQKYSAFKGGLYFNVYDPRFLQQRAGAPIRFTIDDRDFIDTGVRLPALQIPGATEFRALSAMKRDDRRLPTKLEALRQ